VTGRAPASQRSHAFLRRWAVMLPISHVRYSPSALAAIERMLWAASTCKAFSAALVVVGKGLKLTRIARRSWFGRGSNVSAVFMYSLPRCEIC